MDERLSAVLRVLADGPRTAVELVPDVYGEPLTQTNAGSLLSQTLGYMTHLERGGSVARERDGRPARGPLSEA